MPASLLGVPNTPEKQDKELQSPCQGCHLDFLSHTASPRLTTAIGNRNRVASCVDYSVSRARFLPFFPWWFSKSLRLLSEA